jgi:hypothetical protein
VPYPVNPNPCDPEQPEPDCIEPGDFAAYLFLPTTLPLTLPDDFGPDNWKLTSEPTGDPVIDANPQELFGVKGASVDRAWQVSTGRPDVIIAVLDSGIRWQDVQPDLVNKYYLNRGELPVPQGSDNEDDPYDRNRDGVFNMADYAGDARVSDQNGNGVADPEDLIFLFSDGSDDDGNGYVDDISGWDFFEDDNDALDEVRYGHGTGESHDSAAEANNGSGEPGTCPNCLLLEVRVGDSFVAEANAFARGVAFAVDSGARVVQEALGTINQTRFGQEAVDYAYQNGAVVIASAADEESNHHNYPANYNHTVEVNSVVRFGDFEGVITQSPRSYLYLNGCTNYGGHIALAVPSSSCSSEATGKSAGVAGLIVSTALNAIDQGILAPYPRDDGTPAPYPLSAEEVKQILISTVDDVNFDARPELDPPLPANYETTIPVPGIAGSERFRSIAGWDQFFGYGRLNADQALRRVAAGSIPPEASIESPAWFATLDPQATPALVIEGRVAANRAASYTYALDVAPGIQPNEEDFVTAAGMTNLSAAFEGALGTIDLAALAEIMPTSGPAVDDQGLPDPDRFTFTVRLRVVDNEDNVAEDRRTLALHHDPDLAPGFPIDLGADGVAAPLTVDLDGDGREEIVVATSNGEVHAFRADGSELPGWPVATDPLELQEGAPAYASGAISTPVRGAVVGSVAVGDLEGDGRLEVVTTDLQGKVYAWSGDGVLLPGFPVATLPQYSFSYRSERDFDTPEGRVPDRTNRHTSDNRVGRALASGPVLANLDGSADGSLEILSGAFDRHLYAWHRDGTPVMGWPVLLKDPEKVQSVDPVTNDVTLRAGSGARIGTKVLVPPSVGDLDGDGDLEVVAVVNEEYREAPNAVFSNGTINLFITFGVLDVGNTRAYALHADGAAHGDSGLARGWNPDAFLPGWPVKSVLMTTDLLPVVGTGSNGPPALADVDGDGRLEVATMSVIGPPYIFDADGVSFLGREDTGEDVTFAIEPLGAASNGTDTPSVGGLGSVTLAEFAGPGEGFYLLAPTAGLGKLIDNQLPARQFPAENHLSAWRVSANGSPDGTFAEAFPRVVNDLQFLAAPAVADVDGDALPEAIQGTGVYDVHAVDVGGNEAPGWPKFTNGWMIGTPAVGDVDGDGLLEVVAVTREGNLFVWNTTGDECGVILWRRFHHDERGTGNYHTDARPPASLPATAVSAAAASATQVELRLDRVPGDDLYCGTAQQFDVRFSESPIEDDADFASATRLDFAAPAGSRGAASIVAGDESFAGRTLHFALVATDGAGNRSALTSFGAVEFPAEPTPTDTATVTPTPTPTAVDSPTPTPSETPTPTPSATPTAADTATATPTATSTRTSTAAQTPTATPTQTPRATPSETTAPPSATATPTATIRNGIDGGCQVAPAAGGGAAWLVLPAAVLILRLRRRR